LEVVMAKPFFRVVTNKPVFLPLEKLHSAAVFFEEDERLFKLTPFRPGGVYILQSVVDSETLIKLGLMEEPVEEPVEEESEEESQEPEEESEEEPEDEAV
jgi:hypothetical protein